MRRPRVSIKWLIRFSIAVSTLAAALAASSCHRPWVMKVVAWNHLSWNFTQDAPYTLQLPEVGEEEVYVAPLGHATVLIKAKGQWILTDPVLHSRFGPEFGALLYANVGPHRLTPLPIAIDDLPPIDYVLISHAHLDHLCFDSLEDLADKNPALTIVVPTGTKVLLKPYFKNVVELGWHGNQTSALDVRPDLQIQALEVEHAVSQWVGYGGEGFSRDKTSANGYKIKVKSAQGKRHTIAFFGDTGFYDTWHWGSRSTQGKKPKPSNWRGRFINEHVALAILPIGDGYYWWNHIDPAQAVEIHRLIGARYFMPMVHDVFIHSPSKIPKYKSLDAQDVPLGADLGELRRLVNTGRFMDSDEVVGKRIGSEVVFRLEDFAIKSLRDEQW